MGYSMQFKRLESNWVFEHECRSIVQDEMQKITNSETNKLQSFCDALVDFHCWIDFPSEAISADESYRSCQQEECKDHET